MGVNLQELDVHWQTPRWDAAKGNVPMTKLLSSLCLEVRNHNTKTALFLAIGEGRMHIIERREHNVLVESREYHSKNVSVGIGLSRRGCVGSGTSRSTSQPLPEHGIPNYVVAVGRPVSGMATTSASLSRTSFRAGLNLPFELQSSRGGLRVLRLGPATFGVRAYLWAASLMLALHVVNFTQPR